MKAGRWFFMNFIGTTLTAGRTTVYGGMFTAEGWTGNSRRNGSKSWNRKISATVGQMVILSIFT